MTAKVVRKVVIRHLTTVQLATAFKLVITIGIVFNYYFKKEKL